MSTFDFAVQFLDPGKMKYWGKIRDTDFWIENANVRPAGIINRARCPAEVCSRKARMHTRGVQ